jgi:apolipoprotein N-acyltransferase
VTDAVEAPSVRTRAATLLKSPRGRLALAIVAGAMVPLGFAPFEIWLVPILSLAVLLVLIEDAAPRAAARLGFAWGAATFLTGTYWLYHSLHVLGGAPVLLALLLMVGLVAIMGLYPAAFAWLYRRLGGSGVIGALVLAPGLWTLLEWWRGWFMSGFPWLSQGYAQTDAPLGGLAPLVGVYGISLACAVSAGALTQLRPRAPRQFVIALVTLTVIWGSGLVLEQRSWTEPSGDPIRVAMVQGNVAQEDKWDPDFLYPTMDLYLELTDAHWDADLVIWPEAAIPALLHQVDQDFLPFVAARAEASDTEVVFGILRREDELYYNSLVTLRGGEIYSKRHLVPFGEYFPVPEFVRAWMRLMDLPYADIEPGPAGQTLLRAAGLTLGATICYEDAYGQDQLRSAREADLLINVSNDAWFGTSIAPHQHLQIARMRAREAGRPMLRATNTGITAIIGAQGEILATLPQFEVGVLAAEVQPYGGLTPFARWGDWPALLLALLLVAVPRLAAAVLRRRR